jgi:putative spermidine/putrescine transport system permease protein
MGAISASAPAQAPIAASRWARRWLPWMLLAPVLVYLAVFYLVPLAIVIVSSVTDPSPSLSHYRDFFTDSFYLRVLSRTFATSLIVTICCLVLAYPLAYAMARREDTLVVAMLTVVALTFWTSFLVRTYAWMVILGNRGPITALFRMVGWDPPPEILFTRFSSTLAMVHILLPFMVMALYSVMKKIDPALLRAAQNLGASPGRTFRHVYFPLSAPGVVNGCTMVFILCLGFYVTPVLLGSPREQMLAGLIGSQIEELLDFGEASAMAVVLLLVTLGLVALYNRFVGIDTLWG